MSAIRGLVGYCTSQLNRCEADSGRLDAAASERISPRTGSSLSGFHIGDEHGIGTIKLREQPLQVTNLRQVVNGDVGIGWIAGEKILMIPFRRVKRVTRLDLGNDGTVEGVSLIELINIGRSDLCLLRVNGERWPSGIACRYRVPDG